MKGRHQFKRRFSLQPTSFLREIPEKHHSPPVRSESTQESDSEDAATSASSPPGGIRYKIVVMGGAKVGKSSIISQFLYDTFSPKYKRTIEEMHKGEFGVHGVSLVLDILDTSGSFEFPAMRALSISSAEAFILVYSLTDSASFDEVKAIREQIIETKGTTSVPIVVVGNKTDLVEDEPDCREVPTEMAESVVTVDWENGFVETSAKDNVNISQVFKELLTQAKVKYNLSPALRRRRRQSLPTAPPGTPSHNHPAIPSAAQLAHLQSIREKQATHSGKRNSCLIS